jgi:hypothetical protein
MVDIIDLFADISPSLKVGWILWCSSGLALGWFWLARETQLTAALAPVAPRVARSPAAHREPWDLSHPTEVSPAVCSDVSAPSSEERDRLTKKSRRRRRTAD